MTSPTRQSPRLQNQNNPSNVTSTGFVGSVVVTQLDDAFVMESEPASAPTSLTNTIVTTDKESKEKHKDDDNLALKKTSSNTNIRRP